MQHQNLLLFDIETIRVENFIKTKAKTDHILVNLCKIQGRINYAE